MAGSGYTLEGALVSSYNIAVEYGGKHLITDDS